VHEQDTTIEREGTIINPLSKAKTKSTMMSSKSKASKPFLEKLGSAKKVCDGNLYLFDSYLSSDESRDALKFLDSDAFPHPTRTSPTIGCAARTCPPSSRARPTFETNARDY